MLLVLFVLEMLPDCASPPFVEFETFAVPVDAVVVDVVVVLTVLVVVVVVVEYVYVLVTLPPATTGFCPAADCAPVPVAVA
jgi:hypothetical protein